MNDSRAHEIKLPRCWGSDDVARPLAAGETCAVLGNALYWKKIDRISCAEIDMQWRSTPLVLWGKILNEAFGTYDLVSTETYEYGVTPCDELLEGETMGSRLEFFDEMGIRPPEICL